MRLWDLITVGLLALACPGCAGNRYADLGLVAVSGAVALAAA